MLPPIRQRKQKSPCNVKISFQDLCCGVDKDGKEISATKLLAAVASLVSDGTIGWAFIIIIVGSASHVANTRSASKCSIGFSRCAVSQV